MISYVAPAQPRFVCSRPHVAIRLKPSVLLMPLLYSPLTMLRYLVRRALLIPIVLIAVNFLGFAYARLAQQVNAASSPFIARRTSLGAACRWRRAAI